MNIWIDFGHIPQYNFYKPIISQLTKDGHFVFITYLRRGRMPQILKHELGGNSNVKLYQIGIHRMNRLSVWVEANLLRNFQLFFWMIGKKIDVILSNGYQAAMVGYLWRIPSYSFDDDPQTIDYHPKLWFNKQTHYCIYKYEGKRKLSPKAIILPVLKEWAYLSPSSFSPDSSVLLQYGVKPKEYIFIREVTVGTMNYVGQASGGILAIASKIPGNLKVLFSLEEKGKRNLYPRDWILLLEPLKDVHSLIYYSAGLISSGDSMAREAALLGVPSYYLGVRDSMPANKTAHEVANMQSASSMQLEKWLQMLILPEKELFEQQEKQRAIANEKFIDVKQYVLDTIYKDMKA